MPGQAGPALWPKSLSGNSEACGVPRKGGSVLYVAHFLEQLPQHPSTFRGFFSPSILPLLCSFSCAHSAFWFPSPSVPCSWSIGTGFFFTR